MIARIVINKHIVKKNAKHGTNEPPISIQTSRGVERAHEVFIGGTSRLVYRPDNPLKCGASVWIETTYETLKQTTYEEPGGGNECRAS